MILSKSSRLVKIVFGAGLLALVGTGCKNDEENMYTLSGFASGAEEVPAVSTPAAGNINGTYDSDSKMLKYTIYWSNLKDSVTAMHFHGPAMPGQIADPVLPIPPATRTKNGTTSRSETLTDAQATDLLAGRWYYNIHTKSHPAGEIRGQVRLDR